MLKIVKNSEKQYTYQGRYLVTIDQIFKYPITFYLIYYDPHVVPQISARARACRHTLTRTHTYGHDTDITVIYTRGVIVRVRACACARVRRHVSIANLNYVYSIPFGSAQPPACWCVLRFAADAADIAVIARLVCVAMQP